MLDTVNDPCFADLTPAQIGCHPRRRWHLYRLGINDLTGSCEKKGCSAIAAEPALPGQRARTSAGVHRDPSSAGLGYHPSARTCQGPVLLSLHGDRRFGVAHPRRRMCTNGNAASWPVHSLIVSAAMKVSIIVGNSVALRLWRPLRSCTLAAKLAELGVASSFSRPRVSNDNAYAESWFRTMKYHQSYPLRRFRDLRAREGLGGCLLWTGTTRKHRHSGIQYVTPNQRHHGRPIRSAPNASRPMSRLGYGIRNAGADPPAIGLSPADREDQPSQGSNLQQPEVNEPRPPWLSDPALTKGGIGNSRDQGPALSARSHRSL